jgi:hypothetical protein
VFAFEEMELEREKSGILELTKYIIPYPPF